MVDLPVGRAAALGMAALLAGCSAGPRPGPAAEPAPQASNAVRRRMDLAIQAGDRAALTRDAILLAEMGGGMSDRGFDSFAAKLDDTTLLAEHTGRLEGASSRVEALRQWYHANAAPYDFAGPQRIAEVPADFRLVEGIAYDKATDRLFVGTVVEGRLAYLHGGQWHEVPIGFPRSGLFGMAIDAKRRLLWIATGAADETEVRDDPMAGLIAVDLDRLTVARRVPLAAPTGVPGDVAIGPDGTVYLSDGKTGAVHILRPGSAGLATLVAAGRLKSTQGMAATKDGKHLYLADYASGLWIVRLRDGRMVPIGIDHPAMLDGIDGLVMLPWQNALIAIQNGTVPRRVLKLDLSLDGTRITRIDAHEIVPAADGDPSLGTLNGTDLWFVGDGQWERYGPGGAIKDGKPPRPTPILSLFADDIVVTSR